VEYCEEDAVTLSKKDWNMNGLMFRTVGAIVVLLASIAIAVYRAAHNMDNTHLAMPFLVLAAVGTMVLEVKIKMQKPLPPLLSLEEAKVVLERSTRIGRSFFLPCLVFIVVVALFALFFRLTNRFPILSVLILGPATLVVAIQCVSYIRGLSKKDMPANYVWMFAVCSILGTIGMIFICGDIIRGALAPSSLS
jgi:hypothetical protein